MSYIIPLPVADLKQISLSDFIDLFKPTWEGKLETEVKQQKPAKILTFAELDEMIARGETELGRNVGFEGINYDAVDENTPTYYAAYQYLYPYTKWHFSTGRRVQCAPYEYLGQEIIDALSYNSFGWDTPDCRLAKFLIGLREITLPPPENPQYGALAAFKYFYHNIFAIPPHSNLYTLPTFEVIRFAKTILDHPDKWQNGIWIYEWEFEDKGGIEECLHDRFPSLLPPYIPYLIISHH